MECSGIMATLHTTLVRRKLMQEQNMENLRDSNLCRATKHVFSVQFQARNTKNTWPYRNQLLMVT